jgi:hypothetical protein
LKFANRNPALQREITFAALLIVAMWALSPAAGSGQQGPARLATNESYVEDVGVRGDFDIADPKAVFRFVLNSLPERVKVYPTENYYYFSFHHGGVRYSGNIRLENETRDQGKVHFTYGIDSAAWKQDDPIFHILLDHSHDVIVEKLDMLEYRIAHADKSVTFMLNDLSKVVPPPGILTEVERYIGPVFDESAIRFFLVYNFQLKIFHYILDETAQVPDVLAPSHVNKRILIGKRTGFAFYHDHRRERKILIGVFEQNARLNTSFDGPFDQLPDNFLQGETLRSAILAIDPALKGRIDRYGGSFDGRVRYAISPYRHYAAVEDLAAVHRCAVRQRNSPQRYYSCFFDSGSDRQAPLTARARRNKRAVPRNDAGGR